METPVMYGMINDAIRQMVLERHGEAAWQEMCRRAGAQETFLRMEQYPDELTYRLVTVATEMLGAPVADVLRDFGVYWVGYADEAYGELISLAGDSFVEVVENLDALHARVGQMIPQLVPPSFLVAGRHAEQFTLHYYSQREGLAPMVIGLLQGLGHRFDTEVSVTHTVVRGGDHDHDEFTVRYRPQ
jgi:hypothetical protein